MKIVDRATFLTMPPGTVFTKYEPCMFDDLLIKGDSLPHANGFYYQQIVDSIDCDNTLEMVDALDRSRTAGQSVSMDFDVQTRDGLYDAHQLFAVWEAQDVRALIARLGRALDEAAAYALLESFDDD